MNYVAAIVMCVTSPNGYQSCNPMPQPFYSVGACIEMVELYQERALTGPVEYFCVKRNAQGQFVRVEQ